MISVPDPGKPAAFDSDYRMRRLAVDLGIPVITNLQLAESLVNAFASRKIESLKIKSWDEYE